jgi:hypothetical protein
LERCGEQPLVVGQGDESIDHRVEVLIRVKLRFLPLRDSIMPVRFHLKFIFISYLSLHKCSDIDLSIGLFQLILAGYGVSGFSEEGERE